MGKKYYIVQKFKMLSENSNNRPPGIRPNPAILGWWRRGRVELHLKQFLLVWEVSVRFVLTNYNSLKSFILSRLAITLPFPVYLSSSAQNFLLWLCIRV